MGWRRSAYRIARPLLFRTDPEWIHEVALRGVSVAGALPALGRLASGSPPADVDGSPIERVGLRFRNRVGLAAGFDKDARAVTGWTALGFGFVELGTVTPRPQPGNPRPRLVRLTEDEALVNRMGFNNAGAAALARRVAAARERGLRDGFVIGVNVGRNRDGDIEDYALAAHEVRRVADYLVVNVSSPNTPGLRDLQEPRMVRRLVGSALDAGGAGVVVSNTTIGRDRVRSSRAGEPGGLSGRPLRDRTRHIVAQVRRTAASSALVVASGGVMEPADARAAIDAGADLVQLWTGMLYAGPGLIGESIRATAGC